MDDSYSILNLRGSDFSAITEIVKTHTDLSHEELSKILNDKSELTAEAVRLIENKPSLRSELRKLVPKFKPSFYLMFIGLQGDLKQSNPKSEKLRFEKAFALENEHISKAKLNPSIREFKLREINISGDTVEIQFTWEKIYWFWSPSFDFKRIYQLEFGFAVIDLYKSKGVITCHTLNERDVIGSAISNAMGIKLSPLVLTKPILEQIGTFDKVRKARYHVSKTDGSMPENVAYSDEKLGSIPLVVDQENDSNFYRKESFYRIPFGDNTERGVGATSDSGKLWMPQLLTLGEVKTYTTDILDRITKTIDELKKEGKYPVIIESIGISKLDVFKGIRPLKLREEIYRILIELILMLRTAEKERSFALSKELVISGIPKYFNYPRLQYYDSVLGTNQWYIHDGFCNQFKLSNSNSGDIVVSVPNKKDTIDFFQQEGISGEIIGEIDVLNNLQLHPTPELLNILKEGLKMASNEFTEIDKDVDPHFTLELGKLIIHQTSKFATGIEAREIDELKQIVNKDIDPDTKTELVKIIRKLKEACDHQSDSNCETCVSFGDKLCLRSLLGGVMQDEKILRHKNIELCDLQGKFHVDGKEFRVFCFSKEGKLSVRSPGGSVLLSQIVCQLDKPDFDMVCILTSSSVEQDLQNRLNLLCSTYRKKLLVIDIKTLIPLYNHWHEEKSFNQDSPNKILKFSSKRFRSIKLS